MLKEYDDCWVVELDDVIYFVLYL